MDLMLLQEPAFIWFVIGLVLILAEFVAPGLVIIFFGVGAWTVALIRLAVHIDWFWQILLFTLVSIVTLVLLRRRLQSLKTAPEQSMDEFIGKAVEVKETIPPEGYGKVYFKGALWKAASERNVSLKPGTWVKIVSYDSIVLKVK